MLKRKNHAPEFKAKVALEAIRLTPNEAYDPKIEPMRLAA
jgi:hypothetical protein